MSGKSTNRPYINPRFRAYGRARIDIAQRAQTRADWDRLWKKPQYPFAFSWGEPWKQCIEYRVDDFAAEVGFFIDILGLPVRAFSPEFAMFTSPDEAFNFAVVPTQTGSDSTPPDAFRLQFMLSDLFEVCETLSQRGVIFDRQAQPVAPDARLWIAAFQTPHGIPIELWGMVEQAEEGEPPEEVDGIEEDYGVDEEGDEFESEPEEVDLNQAFEAARRRVAAERPELAAPPDADVPRKIQPSAEEMLADLGRQPVYPAQKSSSDRPSEPSLRTFEPTYEPLDDAEAEADQEAMRRFPQEYHYRPIRLDETPGKEQQ